MSSPENQNPARDRDATLRETAAYLDNEPPFPTKGARAAMDTIGITPPFTAAEDADPVLSQAEEIWLEGLGGSSEPEEEPESLLDAMADAMEKRAKRYHASMTPASDVSLKFDAYDDLALNKSAFSEDDHAELDKIEDRLMRQYLMDN